MWSAAYLILTPALAFIALAAIFRPLERVFPAKPGQKLLREHFRVDLWFFLGQYLLWNGLTLWLLDHFGHGLREVIPQSFRDGVASMPFWLQAIIVILASDFLIYWGHRFQHRVDFLWRFHAIHHSAEHLDWLAAHREHPVDSIFTIGLVNLPLWITGFPLETIALLVGFRGLWAIYIHSNVRLPIPWVRWLIGAPELHHWHHDRARDAGNYANLSPVMDLIFGTYVCPDHEPQSFGIHEPIPQNYWQQLIWPFRRRPKPKPDDATPR
jgi:sterol desaturase/sphingolipid hydroxylase (fatty acid hydroxylase superfamily)